MNEFTLIDFLKTALSGFDVPNKVLNNMEFYARRAVMNLQTERMFPPERLMFLSGDKREIWYEGDTERFSYYKLPADFLEIDRFLVDGNEKHRWIDSVERLADFNVPIYTVDHLPEYKDDEKPRPVLAVRPFPTDHERISIAYMSSGELTDLERVDKRYYEAFLTEVQRQLGVIPDHVAEARANDQVDRTLNPRTRHRSNETQIRTKPLFFGGRDRGRRSAATFFGSRRRGRR